MAETVLMRNFGRTDSLTLLWDEVQKADSRRAGPPFLRIEGAHQRREDPTRSYRDARPEAGRC